MDPTVFIALDKFVVALANGSAGNAALIAVMWVVPEKRLSLKRFTFQNGDEIFAVDFVTDLDTGCSCYGWIEVDRTNRLSAYGPCFGDARIANDPWLANATFVDPTFAAAKGEVAGR